jgi:hypothetical protein
MDRPREGRADTWARRKMQGLIVVAGDQGVALGSHIGQ